MHDLDPAQTIFLIFLSQGPRDSIYLDLPKRSHCSCCDLTPSWSWISGDPLSQNAASGSWKLCLPDWLPWWRLLASSCHSFPKALWDWTKNIWWAICQNDHLKTSPTLHPLQPYADVASSTIPLLHSQRCAPSTNVARWLFQIWPCQEIFKSNLQLITLVDDIWQVTDLSNDNRIHPQAHKLHWSNMSLVHSTCMHACMYLHQIFQQQLGRVDLIVPLKIWTHASGIQAINLLPVELCLRYVDVWVWQWHQWHHHIKFTEDATD